MNLLVRVKLGYTPNFTFLGPSTLLFLVGRWVIGLVEHFGNKADLKSFGLIVRCDNKTVLFQLQVQFDTSYAIFTHLKGQSNWFPK